MPERDEFERAARLLETRGDYRVLRVLPPVSEWELPNPAGSTRRGLFVDTETTGLDVDADEVIEVALLPFDYETGSGSIVAVGEEQALDELRDPGRPVPPESTRVHGITDEMVRGRTVDEERLKRLVAEADLVISHNASFDRPVLERTWPVFEDQYWACSLVDVDWRGEGHGAGKLDYLLNQYGFFFEGHRALVDCLAGVFLLTRPTADGRPAMASLLESARLERWEVRAVDSPFEKKDLLKKRGYRWDPADRTWWTICRDGQMEEAWLMENVYGKARSIPVRAVTARDRFSRRARNR